MLHLAHALFPSTDLQPVRYFHIPQQAKPDALFSYTDFVYCLCNNYHINWVNLNMR